MSNFQTQTSVPNRIAFKDHLTTLADGTIIIGAVIRSATSGLFLTDIPGKNMCNENSSSMLSHFIEI